MEKNALPTFEEMNSMLRYEGGHLYRKVRRGHFAVGTRLSALNNGYITLRINRRSFCAHRIVWLLNTGKWPTKFLDHINGNRSDNRFENLRECTQSQNLANRKRNKGRLLPKGVYLKAGRFIARLDQKWLGSYTNPDDAAEAYDKALVERFGEFAKTNSMIQMESKLLTENSEAPHEHSR
jgi:hypothetical protein